MGIVTNGTQLATAIDISLNDSIIADVDLRLLHLSHLRPDGVDITIKKIQTSHGTTEDITRNITYYAVACTISNRTTADIDSNMTVGLTAGIFYKVTIIRIFRCCKRRTDRSQTPTTIDATEHGTTADVQCDITTHSTGRLCITTEATATAENVTIDIRGSCSTDLGIITADRHLHITQHVTILTTAKGRAEDMSTSDIHNRFLNIRPGIEVDTLVTLTGTKEIASHRMGLNLCYSTWHTKCSTRHIDCRSTCHVGTFVTAIDTGQNMTALDIHHGITTYRTSFTVPQSIGISRIFCFQSRKSRGVITMIWEVTTTAAEYITIERMAIGSIIRRSIIV